MKTILVFVGLALLAPATPQAQEESHPKRVIYGTVVDQHGQPAKGIGLEAWPLGVALGTRLPSTRSTETGQYVFKDLPWWGKYSVAAEDNEAGYSMFATPGGRNEPAEVELTHESPEAELKVFLPPKAGFLHIHLTDQKTGANISGMYVTLTPVDSENPHPISMSCLSDRTVLVPPDRTVLLNVSSEGYREWRKTARKGKRLHMRSGAQQFLNVQLELLR